VLLQIEFPGALVITPLTLEALYFEVYLSHMALQISLAVSELRTTRPWAQDLPTSSRMELFRVVNQAFF